MKSLPSIDPVTSADGQLPFFSYSRDLIKYTRAIGLSFSVNKRHWSSWSWNQVLSRWRLQGGEARTKKRFNKIRQNKQIESTYWLLPLVTLLKGCCVEKILPPPQTKTRIHYLELIE